MIVDSKSAQWSEISRYDRVRDVEGVWMSARRWGCDDMFEGTG